MGRIVAILAVIALLLSAGATLADDTSEANELFVEAVKLMESVKNVEGVRREGGRLTTKTMRDTLYY